MRRSCPVCKWRCPNSASDAVVMGGNLFIAGWDETSGIELWKTNGNNIQPGHRDRAG